MTNMEYTAAVEHGAIKAGGLVPVHPSFTDVRGTIANMLLTPINSVAEITSRRGSIRANHYHKTDWHYAYVVSGTVLYFERGVGETDIPEPRAYHPGDMFFTPPLREHAMLFAEDTVILTFARLVRSHDNHEADVVRVPFVTGELADKFVP